MPAYAQAVPVQDVLQLRDQGLTDNLIVNELMRRGFDSQQVQAAIAQADSAADGPAGYATSQPGYPSSYPVAPSFPSPPSPSHRGTPSGRDDEEGNIYERIEEIAEGIIDEKWDALLAEVKKIVEWKDKMEQDLARANSDLDKLKEDFTVLHQGVLGKLEDYDGRMRDVGTELKAVGRVFKDVVPQFVENVKELGSITKGMKGK